MTMSEKSNARVIWQFGMKFWVRSWHLKEQTHSLIMDPTSLLQQSLGNTVPHTIMVHWYLLWSGREFRIWPKSGLTFWPHIIDVWHVPSVYVGCEGLPDLNHGPNQPTATIIGEYSASYHDWYPTLLYHQACLLTEEGLDVKPLKEYSYLTERKPATITWWVLAFVKL